jgi:hypothetical protein
MADIDLAPIEHDPRLLRLFACACVRRVRHLLRDAGSRRAVETAEAVADGTASRAALITATHVATAPGFPSPAANAAASAVLDAVAYLPTVAAQHAARSVAYAVMFDAAPTFSPSRANPAAAHPDYAAEQEAQQRILADLAPRPGLTIDPAVLAYEGGLVPRLAAHIYEERDDAAFPVLRDALLDAGCSDRRILDHCEQEEHWRGCWLLDLLRMQERGKRAQKR